VMDHVAQARSRLISQYRDAGKLQAWISIMPRIANREWEPVLQAIRTGYDIETASGHLLDVVGRVVGQPRPIIVMTEYEVFAYQGTINAAPYDVAPYVGPTENSAVPLPDEYYRQLIRAKIARNVSDGSIDSIITLTEFVLGFEVVALIDNEDMSFAMVFEREPDEIETLLIEDFNIIPKPQGVAFTGWST
jgi:hypothetical protein